mmetsp:Transcript_10529/g.14527  ORF Transcript_10529/g.14527 Transcript_10529/m.14527 type:complete len:205 (-) Transcript_10529:259-873(-)
MCLEDPHGPLQGAEAHGQGLVQLVAQLSLLRTQSSCAAADAILARRRRGQGSQPREGVHQQHGPVAHFVVLVAQRAPQQREHRRSQLRHPCGESTQRGHSGSPHRSILQNDSVEHEANEARRAGRERAHRADDVKDLHDELTELAVLDELAQVQQRRLFGVGDGTHEIHNAVHDALLELVAALFAQEGGQEAHHHAVLLRVLGT